MNMNIKTAGLEEIINTLVKDKNLNFSPDRIYDYYNCWGFVAYALSLKKRLVWLDQDEMEDILTSDTINIDDNQNLQVGDIAVYRGYSPYDVTDLLHTAIIADIDGEITYIHKLGRQQLEVIEGSELLIKHPVYGALTEFRRKLEV